VGPAVVARFIVIFSTVTIQVLVCIVFYRAIPQGSLITLLAVVLLGNTVFCALSLIVANVARAAHTANAMANVLMMPMIFLSGAITPMQKMPAWLKSIAYLCPATPLIDSLRQTMLLGNSPLDQWLPVGLLSLFALVFLLIAIRNFKWE
jgi:ABC-2 type transport system permease protein